MNKQVGVERQIGKYHNGQSSFGETTVCRNTITGEWEPIISMSTM